MLVLPQQAVEIRWHTKNKEWYASKGYIFTKFNDFIKVNILDLTLNAKVKIELICDYCNHPYEKQYGDFVKWRDRSPIKKDACKNCSGEKIKESNQFVYGKNSTMQVEEHKLKNKQAIKEKYGVDNASQIEHINDKKKQTTMKNYGVPYYSQSKEYKERVKETSLKKYGVEHWLQSDKIKAKRRESNLDKYGVDYFSQTETFKEKIKETSLERYGVEHPFQSEEVKRKTIETLYRKYGVDNYTKTDEYKIKTKETNLSKYGKESYSQTEEFKERFVATSFEKYGYSNPNQNPEVKAKAIKTLHKNGDIPTSSQQLAIYEMLKNKGYKVELNYPVSSVALDVAIFIDEIKIDLEYDGWYFHQDTQKDRRRDEFLKLEGWKVFRIKSRRIIPSIEELECGLNKLIKTDINFTKLTLSDWELNKIEN